MASNNLPKPDYATSNMRLVGHSEQGGRSDGVQIMVHRGYAYIGHIFSKGFTIVDVRDPSKPEVVKFVAAPPNTWSLHLQVADDLLLVVHNKDMFAQQVERCREEAQKMASEVQKAGTRVEVILDHKSSKTVTSAILAQAP